MKFLISFLFAAILFSSFTNVETEPPVDDIVTIAASTDFLSTLVAAVKAGDLVGVLQGDGPYTVFAPTNEAFAALPDGTLAMLLKPENKEKLVSILTYHVVSGKVMSTDLSDGMKAQTLNEASITIMINDGGVEINDASVVTADISASNGVVHVIDTVLLPPSD
ncbi:UNVERIFIED_CONTAM: hypothetical protein GTU68_001417 [Idotea baltica]|nr:hypothetical protein [Idotea baltica]